MVIIVTFGGDPISKSPFAVGVAAPLDLNKIEVDGLENSEFSYWCTHVALWCLNCLLQVPLPGVCGGVFLGLGFLKKITF